tara:strand:+ start:85 stop:528 length:444 start_codon:yes stop_codon:yes gene_type:complete
MTHKKKSVKPEAEIDYQAKKNLGDKLISTYKKSRKREKKLTEELMGTIPGREHKWHGFGYKETEESKRLNKEIRKEKKFQKWNDKYEASLEKLGDKPITKHGTGSIEKRKLLKLGVYRDKKGGQVLDYPSSSGKAYSNKYKKRLKYK